MRGRLHLVRSPVPLRKQGPRAPSDVARDSWAPAFAGALKGIGVGLLALLAAVPAQAQVAPGYTPQNADERGLWMEMDEAERLLKTSDFVMRDPALNAWVRSVFCRIAGPSCADVRIYIVRTPYFNASMAPNGMLVVWSGLFLRTRDEAELAAVLGHEFTHYRERHSLRLFRDVKHKSDAFSLLGLPVAILTGGLGYSAAQIALIASIYGYSREMERDADAGSIGLLADAGYDPMAASHIWQHVLEEQLATATARGRKPRGDGGMFATHPASRERLATLAALAAARPAGGESGRERYRAALAPFWAALVDDQVKLNDFGGTEMLLANLASDGWTPELLYARGELYRARGRPEDLTAAAGFYRQALAGQGAPVEARRGLGLALLRAGDRAGARTALGAYLNGRPDASDAPMLRQLAEGK